MASETKAQRVERIKREKDGLDVLNDIYRYAKTGESPDPEDIDRFKWYGLYTQNALHSQPGDETLYFMLRVKIEGGYLNPRQAVVLGEISEVFARGSADATTRQDIQFHWIRIADLPEIFERLEKVGLSTLEAAGDCPRNILCCPVNGIDQEQIDDVRDIVASLNDLYRANREFSNLPRKFKVGVDGCSKHCIHHEVQDLAFTARRNGEDTIVFDVSVGGGQASNRRIADVIGTIRRDEILPVASAVAGLYRDFGRRDNRSKARLGHLIEAWGIEAFAERLRQESGVTLEREEGINKITPYPQRSHFGIHPATRTGKNSIGCALIGGRLSGEKLIRLGETLAFYGAEGVTLTTAQNLVLLGVDDSLAAAVCETLDGIGIRPYPSPFEARTQACTGLEFCKFAISETKNQAVEVIDYLNRRFSDFSEPISISFNGCPNGCAHPVIVDLGFVGALFKRHDTTCRGFELIVSGHLEGDKSRFGRKTGIKVSADEIAPLIESLIVEYEAGNHTDFGNFLLEKYSDEPSFSPPS